MIIGMLPKTGVAFIHIYAKKVKYTNVLKLEHMLL